ncbi:unnamed protein product [Pleuronectes platessa]|uniref:Uncharacterized protein n=1 Tax=Pleuronectes platessa TaxID=8262 RepID=A0A9N7YH58_PLEPL|nr:unnamed protein product [Pleuronectes platessa]
MSSHQQIFRCLGCPRIAPCHRRFPGYTTGKSPMLPVSCPRVDLECLERLSPEPIAHRSRGSAPRPAHSLRDTRPELLHVKELSAAPINDFGPQRPPECSEQHGYNAKFQQFPDI